MRHIDDAHSSFALLIDNLIAECLHSRPMHLWPEMMFGVVAVVEPDPIIKLLIAADAPRDRFIRISPVMPVVSVQVGKTVPEIPKGEKETEVVPVQNTQRDKGTNKKNKLGHAPESFAPILALERTEDRFGIFAKETEERVLQWMLDRKSVV